MISFILHLIKLTTANRPLLNEVCNCGSNKLETSWFNFSKKDNNTFTSDSLQHFLLSLPGNRVLLLLDLRVPAPCPKVLQVRDGLVPLRRDRVGDGVGSHLCSVPLRFRTYYPRELLRAPAGRDEPDGDESLAHVVVHGHEDHRGEGAACVKEHLREDDQPHGRFVVPESDPGERPPLRQQHEPERAAQTQ